MQRAALFFLLSSLGTLTTTGCLARPPAPPLPEPMAPNVDASPNATGTPPGNQGRLVIDVEGDRAKVFDVTEITTRTDVPRKGPLSTLPLMERRMRPLCITPCAVDLTPGWHSLVFESTSDETRTSTADVTVMPRATGVRHALGHERPINGGYVAGLVMVVPAVGFFLMGSLATAVGATADAPGVDAMGKQKSDARVFLPIGLVLLGVGAALGISGGLLMANNRPEKQPGSTTTWFLPSAAPAL